MTTLGGKYGVVNGRNAVSNWNINDSQALPPVITSATGGATDRVAGINSWDGGFTQQLAQPETFPGETLSFAGLTAPDDGTPSGTGVVYSGTALVNSLTINWDWAGGAVLNAVSTFLGHLGLSIGSANHQDAGASAPYTICGTKIEYSSNGTVWTELTNCASAALTLSCATNDYVNSSTGCNTGRAAGPKDWTLAVVIDDTSRSSPVPSKNDSLQWKIWVNDTIFYRMKWGIVRDFTGITVDRVSGAIVKQTMNVDMDISDGSGLGAVAKPDGTFWQGTAF